MLTYNMQRWYNMKYQEQNVKNHIYIHTKERRMRNDSKVEKI